MFREADAEFFLQALFGGLRDGYIELRAIADHGRPKQFFPALPLPQVFHWRRIAQLNKTHSITVRMAISTQPRSDAIHFNCLPALWVDVDGSRDVDALHALPIPPSLVVSSGGGLHAYWLLDQPLDISNLRARRQARDLLLALARAAGGDEQVCDVSRVMRLPGSVNRKAKYAENPPVARLLVRRKKRVSVSEIEGQFALWLPLPTPEPTRALPARADRQPIPDWVDAYLKGGAGLGLRNATLFRAACALRARGWDESAISSLLTPRGLADGLTDHEISSALRSATRYPAQTVPRHLRRIAALEDEPRD